MSESQSQTILAHLKSGKSITPLDALNLFRCFRLSGRIYDLQKQGHKIKHELVTEGGKTFARYSLGDCIEGNSEPIRDGNSVSVSGRHSKPDTELGLIERPEQPPVFFKGQGYLPIGDI